MDYIERIYIICSVYTQAHSSYTFPIGLYRAAPADR
jgi:hypothetical protein